jgi:hypothetical protein
MEWTFWYKFQVTYDSNFWFGSYYLDHSFHCVKSSLLNHTALGVKNDKYFKYANLTPKPLNAAPKSGPKGFYKHRAEKYEIR